MYIHVHAATAIHGLIAVYLYTCLHVLSTCTEISIYKAVIHAETTYIQLYNKVCNQIHNQIAHSVHLMHVRSVT